MATENNKPTLRSAPHFVVVPLGTGNLLLGAYLAIQDFRDWLEVNEFEHFIVPVAAIAFGKENLLSVMRLDADWSPWSRWHEHWEPRKSNDNRAMVLAPKPPLAPKVTGVYSPLAAWINREVWVGETVFVEVDQSDQITARACMRPHRPVRGQIGSAEPSALLAFAALPGLEAWLKAEHQRPPERRRAASMGGRQLPEVSKARILVVNTGSGAVSSLEQDFLTQIPKKS